MMLGSGGFRRTSRICGFVIQEGGLGDEACVGGRRESGHCPVGGLCVCVTYCEVGRM
jgi:hypothetical protein